MEWEQIGCLEIVHGEHSRVATKVARDARKEGVSTPFLDLPPGRGLAPARTATKL
jgi:hypothetical protein